MKHLNEHKLFVQRIGLVGITNILVALSSLILLPILTKSFSISNYGIWVQVNVSIALITQVATLGLPYSMLRFLSTKKDINTIQEGFYSTTLFVSIISLLISLSIFIFSKKIASTLFNGNIGVTLILSGTLFVACINVMLLNFFRTFQEMKKYSLIYFAQTYLSTLIVSYLTLSGYKIEIAVLGLLISNIIILIFMSYNIISEIGFKFPRFKFIKEYLCFGLPTIPSNLSYWAVDSIDRYFIGIFLGAAFVGYYSPGYTLGNVIMMISAPFSLILPSVLPKYYDGEKNEIVSRYLKYSLKYFLLISIPLVIGLSFLSKPILDILTTTEIASQGYLITPFIAVSCLLFGFYVIISNSILLAKKTKVIGSIWVITALINICLNVILIPIFGIIGAAFATLFSYIFVFVMGTYYSLKYVNLKLDLSFIIKVLISSLLIVIIILLIEPNGIIDILVSVGISIVVYIVTLIIFKVIKKEELKFLKTFLSRDT